MNAEQILATAPAETDPDRRGIQIIAATLLATHHGITSQRLAGLVSGCVPDHIRAADIVDVCEDVVRSAT